MQSAHGCEVHAPMQGKKKGPAIKGSDTGPKTLCDR